MNYRPPDWTPSDARRLYKVSLAVWASICLPLIAFFSVGAAINVDRGDALILGIAMASGTLVIFLGVAMLILPGLCTHPWMEKEEV
jgi:hypothetical protein